MINISFFIAYQLKQGSYIYVAIYIASFLMKEVVVKEFGKLGPQEVWRKKHWQTEVQVN